MVGPVAGWLAGAAISDAYTRTVNRLGPDEAERLERRVRKDTGVRFPRKRFYDWYLKDSTWAALCRRDEESYDLLRRTLSEDLWDRPSFWYRAPEVERRSEVAGALVNATIGHFMQNLDPAMAVGVHDARETERHKEVLRSIDGKERLDERLQGLPPTVVGNLEELRQRDPQAMRRLVDWMEEANVHPAVAVRDLLAGPVPWLADLPGAGMIALAEYAAAHGLASSSADLFERAAEQGVRRAWCLARGALQAAGAGEVERALHDADDARSRTAGDQLVEAAHAAVTGDEATVLEVLDGRGPFDEPVLNSLLGTALANANRLDEAIELLRSVGEANQGWSGLALLRARLLTNRALSGGSPSKDSDLREAIQSCRGCRDARRRWAGPSADAVAAACRAAAIRGDHEEVVRLGSPAPSGEATVEEVASSDVQDVVMQALIGIGDIDEALRMADAAPPSGRTALIRARACIIRGADASEVRRHLDKAWSFAANLEDKVDVWSLASLIGVEPLPSADELDSLEPDLADLFRAQSARANGRTGEAISLLRRHAGRSEYCAVALAHAYASEDRVDDAVAELRQAADRFQRPRLLLGAAESLLRHGRPADAREVAHPALALLPVDHPDRRHARELLLAAAQSMHDWRSMEIEARQLITEGGSDPAYRWALTGALFNQSRLPEAWRALTADGDVEPQDGMTAGLWAQLHCRFDPTPATTLRSTELLEQYIDEAQPALAIAMAVLTMDALEAPDEALMTRWSAALNQFVERYPDSPGLRMIKFDDDLTELRAYLRDTVGTAAPAIAEMQEKVSLGSAPYGLLAAIGNRPYAATLLQRGAGCLLIYPGDRGVATVERQDAAESLGKQVVIDPSVLVVSSFTDGLWEHLQSEFHSLIITDAALADVISSQEFHSRGTGMTLSWDPERAQPVTYSEDADLLAERRRRAALCEDRARRDTREVSWPEQRAFTSDETDTNLDNDPRLWSWISGLDYAKANALPFVCDDVALRQLARSEGVTTFGSAALIEVLERQRKVSSDVRAAMVDSWFAECCVDLPDPTSLLSFATAHGFDTSPAALTMIRPGFWQDPAAATACYSKICSGATTTAPDQLPLWLFAAIRGAGTGRNSTFVAQFAAHLLLHTTALASAEPDLFAQLVAAARSAVESIGAELHLEYLFRVILQRLDPQAGPLYLLELSSSLPVGDRDLARRVAFGAA